MKNLFIVFIFAGLFSFLASADENVFKIEIGKDFKSYTSSDLQRRVWELERAVAQLQAKVFQLEAAKPEAPKTWVCTVSAMGEEFTGAGDTKATATNAVMENCRKSAKDTFFCKHPKCDQ
jgi:hypothetical protein